MSNLPPTRVRRDHPPHRVGPRGGRRLLRLPLALLVLAAACFLALGAGEAWRDSPTFDEPVYVAAGVAAVLHQDLTLNAEHPPLPKVLAVLPVLLAHPVVPTDGRWSGNNERAYSARFVDAQLRAGTLRRVTFAARLVPLAETAGVAFAIFALGSELLGTAAGAFGGILWLTSPFVLGIGHLDGTDVPFALAVVLSSWALARWLRLRSRRSLHWLGLALAGPALTEISGLLITAAGLAVVAAAGWRSGVRPAIARAGAAGLICLAAIWLPYLAIDPSVLAHPVLVVPRPYADGIAYLWSNDTTPGPGYIAGISYTGGRWWFWPLSLLIKLPAPTVILLAAGTAAWWQADRGQRQRALLTVAVPAVLLTAFTMTTPRDIGLRYLLPVIALWAAAAGALVPALARLRPAGRRVTVTAAAGLLAAAAVITAVSFPESLSWTEPPSGPGYAVVTDSNVDWGQGLYALRSWSAGHRPWVAYFGPRGITGREIPAARPLLGTSPAKISGWAAVSATALTSADRFPLAWIRGYCPVAVLAGSILIYHFSRPPGPAPVAGAPPAPCPGRWSSAPRR
jgi:4-amino-4-deoxy-L-arabinose transferase-like glycosyltransferase